MMTSIAKLSDVIKISAKTRFYSKHFCKQIYHFQTYFPEDGHDPKLVGKLYYCYLMTLYPFFPVQYTLFFLRNMSDQAASMFLNFSVI